MSHWRRRCVARRTCSFSTSPSQPSTRPYVTTCVASSRQLQRDTNLATVVVTHDPEEAAYLADDVIVIDQGVASQTGPTRQVFGQPTSPGVARLLGVANVNHGVVSASGSIDASGVHDRHHRSGSESGYRRALEGDP